jgi:hypothetical protein
MNPPAGATAALDALLLLLVLAAATATPVLELLALGFMFGRAGAVAQGAPLRQAFALSPEARRIITALIGLGVVFLPVVFFRSILREQQILEGSRSIPGAVTLAVLGGLAGAHAWVALCRGRFSAFFRPITSLKALRAEGPAAELDLRARAHGLGRALAECGRAWLILGVLGLLGSALWYLPPAAAVALRWEHPLGVLLVVLGLLGLVAVVAVLPFLQAHFAAERRLAAFTELAAVRARMRRAPLAHALALLVFAFASLPLQAFHIFTIPRGAESTMAFLALLLLYPAHLIAAWAYARGGRATRDAPWLLRGLGMGLRVPALLLVAVISLLLPYVAAHGSAAVLESALFLLPLPR